MATADTSTNQAEDKKKLRDEFQIDVAQVVAQTITFHYIATSLFSETG